MVSDALEKFRIDMKRRFGSDKNYRLWRAQKYGFKNEKEYRLSIAKSYGCKSTLEQANLLAKKQGFKSAYDRFKISLKNRGFKTATEYGDYCARKAGFKDLADRRKNWKRALCSFSGCPTKAVYNGFCNHHAFIFFPEYKQKMADYQHQSKIKKYYSDYQKENRERRNTYMRMRRAALREAKCNTSDSKGITPNLDS